MGGIRVTVSLTIKLRSFVTLWRVNTLLGGWGAFPLLGQALRSSPVFLNSVTMSSQEVKDMKKPE
jgi:hypothetical protein